MLLSEIIKYNNEITINIIYTGLISCQANDNRFNEWITISNIIHNRRLVVEITDVPSFDILAAKWR